MTVIKKSTIKNIGEDMKKLEHLHNAGQNVKWCSDFGNQSSGSLNT